MNPWIETYRGTVNRWELDNVDHFTVAYYFDRFADATANALEALHLGPAILGRAPQRTGGGALRAVTADCYVRYLHELRAGDILHILSGVIAVDGDGVLLGHKLFDSEGDRLCATVEQRVRLIAGTKAASLTAQQRRALESRRVTWDGPARETRPTPASDDGFHVAVRDVVTPWEIDLTGQSAMSHYIHRFSAANSQLIALFGMTPAYIRDQRIGFSTFEFQLAFFGELRAGDSVLVKSALLHLGNSSMRTMHKMFNARTDALVATLSQMGVHLDMAARRPTPLPDALRERAKALLVS
jgi:acyl-CoA thioesterase FadM